MKNRTMTLEQAYRYVLRRVDRGTRKQAVENVRKAKNNEKYQFCAWDSIDAMEQFLENYGAGIVRPVFNSVWGMGEFVKEDYGTTNQ